MASLSDVVDSVYPGNNAVGIPLSAGLSVTFDREIDESSVENGGIFIEGADSDTMLLSVYPQELAPGDEPAVLQSPGYSGLVRGSFTFKRIELASTSEVATLDTTGNGTLYRTKAIFTPTFPLQKATGYRLFIVGDPDAGDIDKFGIRTRSVFDPVVDVGNTGNGAIAPYGTYTGVATDTINIQFTDAGVVGQAKFEWWKNSSPLDIHGPILATYSPIPLDKGVLVKFTDGSYDMNDLFTFVVKAGVTFTDSLTNTFTTGNGSILSVPTAASTSVVGDVLPPGTGTTFHVVESTPADFATNLNPAVARQITIEFSSDIDQLTVTQDTVIVVAEPVSDHPAANIISPNGPIAKTLTVDGKKLIINL